MQRIGLVGRQRRTGAAKVIGLLTLPLSMIKDSTYPVFPEDVK